MLPPLAMSRGGGKCFPALGGVYGSCPEPSTAVSAACRVARPKQAALCDSVEWLQSYAAGPGDSGLGVCRCAVVKLAPRRGLRPNSESAGGAFEGCLSEGRLSARVDRSSLLSHVNGPGASSCSGEKLPPKFGSDCRDCGMDTDLATLESVGRAVLGLKMLPSKLLLSAAVLVLELLPPLLPTMPLLSAVVATEGDGDKAAERNSADIGTSEPCGALRHSFHRKVGGGVRACFDDRHGGGGCDGGTF
mmetsp:Transcript_37042/g.104513  ORF Transcript_37042/g.104513 Transcript_37042/m.104513 type:complete len:247 (+) Transcript_37042:236-976(+)